MKKKAKIHAYQLKRNGTYDGYKYDALHISRIMNGRIYFACYRDGMRLCTMAKQMQFSEDGKILISFGKADKIEIGTYWNE